MRRRSTLILGAGTLVVCVGAALLLAPWLEALRWQSSPEAAQAERNAAAPQLVRAWPAGAAATPTLGPAPGTERTIIPRATPVSSGRTDAVTTTRPTPAAGSRGDLATPPALSRAPEADPTSAPTALAPTPTLGPSELKLGQVAFQFQDPPQPGANVLLSVDIHNPSELPRGLVSLDLPLNWLRGYAIRGIDPLPADESLAGHQLGSNLRFTFDGPTAGDDLQIQVFLVTTEEVIDAPKLRVVDTDGREVGQVQPPTEAPPAEPGPVYAIDIPRLHLHTGVVQVDWDPPLFVVGQLRDSAHVTQGNSVLVGHLHGAAGYNVFDHLDQVTLGDKIIATSRGETYEFVVSQRQVLPDDDTSPTRPTRTARLTLMTCTGDWNPLTREYSERLWVVAEPVDAGLAP